MKPEFPLNDTAFLKHRLPLDEDRIVKLVLPVDLTALEAGRIQAFIEALVLPDEEQEAQDWPFPSGITIRREVDADDFLEDLDDDFGVGEEDEDEDEDEDEALCWVQESAERELLAALETGMSGCPQGQSEKFGAPVDEGADEDGQSVS